MKLTAIVCAATALLLAGAAAGESPAPAQLVTQLGSEHLEDRDAASAALLNLGPKARDAVRQALDSKDPEVKSRATELWKTLRWLVIPSADDDIKQLVAEAEKGSIEQSHWQAFVQQHGAESIRLVAEFRQQIMSAKPAANPVAAAPTFWEAAGLNEKINVNDVHPLYEPGLIAVLDNEPPMDVAKVVAETDRANGRVALDALLDEGLPPDAQEKTAVHWMQIQIALWNYEKALDFGRDFSFRTASPAAVKQCAIAVDRGGTFDKIKETADKDIAAETDAGRLCAKLGFYTTLYSDLDKKPFIDPLFDLAQKVSTAKADDAALRRVVESLLNAGLPDRAVKVLHNVQSPLALYMRSAADLQEQDEPVAEADWEETMTALNAVDDAKKKEAYFTVGDLMNDWHDPRAELVWQKILSMAPATTVYDANACFHLGQIMEDRRQYTQAADIYEKGLQISASVQGVLVSSGPQGSFSGERVMREKIRNLRLLAAGQKSIFNDPAPKERAPAPAGTGNDGSQ